ncbi:Small acid-soluble spore protein [Fictibacillus macauensis ZFHKF-1]|uniref:Small acid-soluble spore protein n=1 Tax=Fictibacillus macauensis ZFHKF-1 TaxID=1196324 RepID=I8AGV8_9BACL|nr:H-type small acid-soluble spore protein [Fictibacillus macauensis]EIT84649.1 Small acid-soluble spore protein [Fictibacillus macauensis ZFHKF-1]
MNVERAKQIISSPSDIEVKHQGTSVWIESIDEASQKARVHMNRQPLQSQEVPINELQEQ